MTKMLTQEERVWLLKKVTGATPQTPLNLLRRKYYTGYSGVLGVGENAAQLSLDELEWRWLINYIDDNGGTVEDSDCYADLWIKMVEVLGITATKHLKQNQLIFYSNAS